MNIPHISTPLPVNICGILSNYECCKLFCAFYAPPLKCLTLRANIHLSCALESNNQLYDLTYMDNKSRFLGNKNLSNIFLEQNTAPEITI